MKWLLNIFIAALTAVVMMTGCSANTESSAGAEVSASGSSGQTVSTEEASVGTESAESAESTEIVESTEVTESTESVESEEVAESVSEEEIPESSAASQTSSNETAPAAEETEMSENVKYIALTFDDGPNTTTTNEVIDKLEKYDIVASFFLVGNNINDDSAKAVKRAYDMGCEINNHSRTHSNMSTLTPEDIKEEYYFVDEKVFEITGEHTRFFRPPYIAVSEAMLDNIDVPFIAGIGANDWEEKVTAEHRAKLILKQAKDGDIILLHDAEGNSQTVEALDTIIPELQSQGYKFVTVSELFRIKGIDPDMEKIYTNVTQKYMYN